MLAIQNGGKLNRLEQVLVAKKCKFEINWRMCDV